MTEQEKIRLADYKVDIAAVLDGSRPLAIIEHIKSPEAYKLAYKGSGRAGIVTWHHDVLSSNGKTGPAIAFATDLGILARYQHLRNTAKYSTPFALLPHAKRDALPSSQISVRASGTVSNCCCTVASTNSAARLKLSAFACA